MVDSMNEGGEENWWGGGWGVVSEWGGSEDDIQGIEVLLFVFLQS